jgi:DNA-binding winged helix-turn-helix (wHTH) protein/TolB-like protein/Tfp pilus assembly protein PilF
MEKTLAKTLSFDDFEIDTERRLLLKRGEPLALNPKAFDLLLTLVHHRGEVLSKNELLETVWKGQFVEENNLTVHITALRKILGEKKGENRFIVTVPGNGYKFVGELNAEADGEIIIENRKIERITIDEEIEPETESLNQLPAKQNSSRRFFAPLLVVVAIAAIGFSYWFWAKNQTNAAPIESIAVMPFVYENGGADTEYLSDGMTESLINNLSQLPKLTVKARNSVFQYKGKQFDANKVGSELSVQAILLGRIVERGDNYILSLELIDAKTNNHLWGEQYTRSKSELATLQTEIARDVSAKLRQKLANNESLPKGQTANAEAYQLYLKGRYLWNKRTREDNLKAVGLFEQAIAIDPNFALAFAALGDVYTVFNSPFSPEEKDAKGHAAALKALEIAPDLAEGYAVLAGLEWNAFNRQEAEKHFNRALELNPNYASARQWHAEFLMQSGRREESFAEINRALELDPFSLIINSDAAFLYMEARQYDKGIAQANKTLELDAGWKLASAWLIANNECKGDYAAAIDASEKLVENQQLSDEERQTQRREIKELREVFEKSGVNGYWQKQLEIEKRLQAKNKVQAFYYLAIIYANLGDKANALTALEKSVEAKDDQANGIKVEPSFDSLQAEPRFQALLRRVGLEP